MLCVLGASACLEGARELRQSALEGLPLLLVHDGPGGQVDVLRRHGLQLSDGVIGQHCQPVALRLKHLYLLNRPGRPQRQGKVLLTARKRLSANLMSKRGGCYNVHGPQLSSDVMARQFWLRDEKRLQVMRWLPNAPSTHARTCT